MIALPESWSDWTLTRMIGEGAFAVVYEAQRKDDPSIRAAIKIISIPQDPSEIQELISQGYNLDQTKDYFNQTVDEFIHEVKIMEFFKGTQNIVSIEDYRIEPQENHVGSHIFIRMELLTSLDNYISDKQLSEKEVIRLGIDICTALSLCMSQQVIHRDIKPENIFVNDKIGTHVFYKLGDFGIARSLEHRTAGLSSKGTPNYIAPEVASGKNYDTRADIYSLGLTLYRLLNNNRLPFFPQTSLYTPAAKREAVMRRLSGEQLPPPVNASPKMADVLLKACSYLPEERYQSAEEMKQALLNLENNKPAISGNKASCEMPEQQVVIPKQKSSDNKQNTSPSTDKAGKTSQIFLIVLLTVIVVLLIVIGGGFLLNQFKNDVINELSHQSVITTDTPVPGISTIITPDSTATATVTPEATAIATPEPTATATAEPTATSTATPVPTATATVTPEPTATPTVTPKPTATSTPTPVPTATPAPTVTVTPKPGATKPIESPSSTEKNKAVPTAPVSQVGLTSGVIESNGQEITWTFKDGENLLFEGKGKIPDYSANGNNVPWADLNPKRVYIRKGITGIGSNAFLNCTSIESVSLTSSIKSIGEGAFRGCSRLEQIALPASVEMVDDWAFADCTALKKMTICNGAVRIGATQVYHCPALREVITLETPENSRSMFRGFLTEAQEDDTKTIKVQCSKSDNFGTMTVDLHLFEYGDSTSRYMIQVLLHECSKDKEIKDIKVSWTDNLDVHTYSKAKQREDLTFYSEVRDLDKSYINIFLPNSELQQSSQTISFHINNEEISIPISLTYSSYWSFWNLSWSGKYYTQYDAVRVPFGFDRTYEDIQGIIDELLIEAQSWKSAEDVPYTLETFPIQMTYDVRNLGSLETPVGYYSKYYSIEEENIIGGCEEDKIYVVMQMIEGTNDYAMMLWRQGTGGIVDIMWSSEKEAYILGVGTEEPYSDSLNFCFDPYTGQCTQFTYWVYDETTSSYRAKN